MMAHLTPLSPKAKNRFINAMQSNPVVEVEQVRDRAIFVVSQNRNYCAWIPATGNSDWLVDLSPSSS